MLPVFFDLKLRKWDNLEHEIIELFVRLRTSPLSFSFMSQTEFTAYEIFLISRKVPLLFKCNLLLLRQVLSMLLLFIKIIPLTLHKFPSFLLVSFFYLQMMVTSINNTKQCYFNVIIAVVPFHWGNYFPYFLKSISIILNIICCE